MEESAPATLPQQDSSFNARNPNLDDTLPSKIAQIQVLSENTAYDHRSELMETIPEHETLDFNHSESLISPTSSNDEAKNIAPSSEDLIRRLSVASNSSRGAEPHARFPQLGLSGKVISVNFCVPYKVHYTNDAEWILSPRRGTSALFDSFSYLASTASDWTHILIAWTGEIDKVSKTNGVTGSASATALPINDAAAPVPVNAKAAAAQSGEPPQLTIPESNRKDLEQQLAREQGGRVQPVWLPDHIDAAGNHVFTHQERWRRYGEHDLFNLFHYEQNKPTDGRDTNKAWADYVRMNTAFAKAVMSVYRPGDLVIVHDYHLLLLPGMLRRMISQMYIGFFLHIPFPSCEYYRALPKREELLRSMLGADMIGFQTDSYAEHFSNTCANVLGVAASFSGVEFNSFDTAFEAFPIGIDAATTMRSAFDENVSEKIARLHADKIYEGKKVIVGRDRLDSARGVVQKLQAFELFLEQRPEWREKVVLVQVTSPAGIDHRHERGDKIDAIRTRINGRFGNLGYSPVQYYPSYLTRDEYFALMRIADLGLITSVRDGMNTTALEYVICQRDKKNPLIISEFSGTAASLEHAITINPWDLGGVAETIHQALMLSGEQKADVHNAVYEAVKTNSIQLWTTQCINRLTANLVANDRCQETPALDLAEMVRQYSAASRRLFLFDYDGTLTPIVSDPSNALPTKLTLKTIETLASNPRNAVWIISGRDQKFLGDQLGHISALGFSAEHGCFMRMPSTTEWINLTANVDMQWRESVFNVFKKYCNAVPGSHTESKMIALTWHYRKALDGKQASKQAKKCQKELNDTVAKTHEVGVMAGKANIEVRPHFVNKGEIVKRLVEAYGAGSDNEPDFVLCLGDDSTDEDMFHKLRCSNLPPQQVFAVVVGASNKATLASFCVNEPADVIAALVLLNASEACEGGDEVVDIGDAGSATDADDNEPARNAEGAVNPATSIAGQTNLQEADDNSVEAS